MVERVVQFVHHDQQPPRSRIRLRQGPIQIGQRDRSWFLADHVLARLQRRPGGRGVQMVGQHHVDHSHPRVLPGVGQPGGRPLDDGKLGRQLLQGLRVAAGQDDAGHMRAAGQGRQMDAGPLAAADYRHPPGHARAFWGEKEESWALSPSCTLF